MNAPLLVATRKGLFTLAKQENRWQIVQTSFLGDPVTMVLTDPRDGTWYAALNHGHFGCKLHRSRDRGQTWQACAVPAFPEGTDTSLKQIWALEPGGSQQAGVLWCGTIPGGLFRSSDGGDSWQLVESLWNHPARAAWFGGGADDPGIHSICVDPRDPDHVLVGVSCGGCWVTADGGQTWSNRSSGMRAAYMPPERAFDPDVQDPHLVVQSPSQPDRYWVQHHNGIFLSSDQAASWQEITNVAPSTFGFAVAVHPQDPQTAWFAPAQKDETRIPVNGQVVVTRTRDGGKTFEQLRRGLPQEHAYDLVFRHALDVDAEGQHVAFGSTTGSLWVSADQGDHWDTVSQHLPPIYAVRFSRNWGKV